MSIMSGYGRRRVNDEAGDDDDHRQAGRSEKVGYCASAGRGKLRGQASRLKLSSKRISWRFMAKREAQKEEVGSMKKERLGLNARKDARRNDRRR